MDEAHTGVGALVYGGGLFIIIGLEWGLVYVEAISKGCHFEDLYYLHFAILFILVYTIDISLVHVLTCDAI